MAAYWVENSVVLKAEKWDSPWVVMLVEHSVVY